ncbi:MAG TPA: hypothetical protein DEB35_01210 [Desulfuromonas sp.]|nr:hypothetical protein [Desulfuromonas sp.]
MFSKVVLGQQQQYERTDLNATITLAAINKESQWSMVNAASLGLIPSLFQRGTFDLKLVFAKEAGDIISVENEHEETRTWILSYTKPFIPSKKQPILAAEIAYDLTRSALYKTSQKTPASTQSSQFN